MRCPKVLVQTNIESGRELGFLITGFWPLAPSEIYISAASLVASSRQHSTECTVVNAFALACSAP